MKMNSFKLVNQKLIIIKNLIMVLLIRFTVEIGMQIKISFKKFSEKESSIVI